MTGRHRVGEGSQLHEVKKFLHTRERAHIGSTFRVESGAKGDGSRNEAVDEQLVNLGILAIRFELLWVDGASLALSRRFYEGLMTRPFAVGCIEMINAPRRLEESARRP